MKITLGEVGTYINGYAFKPSDWGTRGLPIIRIQNLTNRNTVPNYFDGPYNPKFEVNKGDILIAWSGSLGIHIWQKNRALLNQHIFRVEFNKCDIDKMYFYYAVKHNIHKMLHLTHGATMRHIIKSDFEQIVIPYPSLEVQANISKILNYLEQNIINFRNILLKLELLIKSRFVEMFGDLNHNPLYPVVNLKNLIIGSPSNGFFASKELYDKNGKVNLVGVKEVVGHLYTNICDTSKLDVDDSTLEKYLIDYGDLLFCRSSLVQSGIAKASIVPKLNNKSCIFECHIIKLKLDQQLCIPEFMQVQSEQTYFRNQVIKNSKTATMTTISQQGIVDTKVLLPPVSIQEEFTKFLSQINKLKSDVQKSIDETQLLMDSLMQEYFG